LPRRSAGGLAAHNRRPSDLDDAEGLLAADPRSAAAASMAGARFARTAAALDEDVLEPLRSDLAAHR